MDRALRGKRGQRSVRSKALRNGIKAGPSVYGRRAARGFYEALPRVLFFSWVKGELEAVSLREVSAGESDR